MQTTVWDVTRNLSNPEATAAYLEAAIEAAFDEGDQAIVTMALGDIARARGMSQVARDAGVTREALYKALSETGDPKLSTLLGVLKALGIKLTATPSDQKAA